MNEMMKLLHETFATSNHFYPTSTPFRFQLQPTFPIAIVWLAKDSKCDIVQMVIFKPSKNYQLTLAIFKSGCFGFWRQLWFKNLISYYFQNTTYFFFSFIQGSARFQNGIELIPNQWYRFFPENESGYRYRIVQDSGTGTETGTRYRKIGTYTVLPVFVIPKRIPRKRNNKQEKTSMFKLFQTTKQHKTQLTIK